MEYFKKLGSSLRPPPTPPAPGPSATPAPNAPGQINKANLQKLNAETSKVWDHPDDRAGEWMNGVRPGGRGSQALSDRSDRIIESVPDFPERRDPTGGGRPIPRNDPRWDQAFSDQDKGKLIGGREFMPTEGRLRIPKPEVTSPEPAHRPDTLGRQEMGNQKPLQAQPGEAPLRGSTVGPAAPPRAMVPGPGVEPPLRP